MSDLRAPDPTLNVIFESGDQPRLVYCTNAGATVRLFHRQSTDDGPDCGTVDPLTMTWPTHINHARYIGTVCREPGCFPDAPPPGGPDEPWCGSPDCRIPFHRRNPHLAWQVPS